jgi:hypothetical protein
MAWQEQLRGDALTWLLDTETSGVRYMAMRDLLDYEDDDPELAEARGKAHSDGPIAQILDEMEDEGYWVRAGAGYNPKYRSAVWSLLMLAQMGARASDDERIERACAYMLAHGLATGGQFTASGAPSGTVDCLQGNMCWTFLELGYDNARLEQAFEWMARTVTGEGLAPNSERQAPIRYYASQCGPTFACGSNNKLPCAWGGAKVMLAFSKLKPEQHTPLIERAIQQGIDFLFSVDPAEATYPSGWSDKPSGNWWKFGFPVFYVTDLLQIVEALVGLGYGGDPRLANALEVIRQKQDEEGRWALDYNYHGKTWVDIGGKRQPDKWVTLRALRVLKNTSKGN